MSKKFESSIQLQDSVRYSSSLAKEIGERESILLLQFEYWCGVLEGRIVNNKKYIYKSIGDMLKTFPSWGRATLHRVIVSLEKQQYISSLVLNKKSWDTTKWYALNWDKIATLKSIKIKSEVFQNGMDLSQNGMGVFQNGMTIPYNTPYSTPYNNIYKEEKISFLPYPKIEGSEKEDICHLENNEVPTLLEASFSPSSPPPIPQSPEEADIQWRKKVFIFSIRTICARYSQATSFSLQQWMSLLDVELGEWRKMVWTKWGNVPPLPTLPLTGAEKYSKLQELKQKHERLYGTCD